MSTQEPEQTFPITGLRSVELAVPDLDRAEAFYTGVWGLSVAGRDAGTIYLQGSGTEAYVVALRHGPAAIDSVTWAAAPDTDLRDLRARLVAAGGTKRSEIGAVSLHGGGMGFSVKDPAGRTLRVVQGAEEFAPQGYTDSRPVRLAHVNINTTDIDRDIAFLESGLGFRLTDRSAQMAFLRTNDDHHAIVLAKAAVNTLNHIAFQHAGWEDVMRAAGRMCDARFPIGWGPGRHGPGDNVFAYFVDPFGFVVEHTAEVLQVDDTYRVGTPADWVWPEGRTDQWGIAPPKTETCKAAQLAIPFS